MKPIDTTLNMVDIFPDVLPGNTYDYPGRTEIIMDETLWALDRITNNIKDQIYVNLKFPQQKTLKTL